MSIEYFNPSLINCEINVDPQVSYIIEDNWFINETGRAPGTEDVFAHQRKGIAGDWKNYFTSQIKDEFKKRFGNPLIQTGYENDTNW